MPELNELGAAELVDGFRSRRFSPVEVLDAVADRIGRVDGTVGGFTTTCLDRAVVEARAAETAWHAGDARELEGVPIGVKDLFDSEGVRTTYGSAMFASHVPARDAEALRRAREAGAILVGKTQTHEFAFGITSINEQLGSTHNPWALDRISGGSSGGSAVALAALEVPLAIGTDTAGSIRVPASLCGVVGLKPTRARVSRAGVFPLAQSFDHVGPMARTPADAALLLRVIADPGTPLPTTATRDEPPGFRELRVGVCPDLHFTPLGADVREIYDNVVRTAEGAGAEVVEATLPEAAAITGAFVPMQRAEALRSHRRAGLYPSRRDEYGPDVLRLLEMGLDVTLDAYLDAAVARERVQAGFRRLFTSCDVLLTPAAAGPPFPDGAEVGEHLGRTVNFRDLVLPYTTPQNLCGLPCCVVRAGFDSAGLPVGAQFTGPPWSDGRVLRAAQALYECTPDVQARAPALP